VTVEKKAAKKHIGRPPSKEWIQPPPVKKIIGNLSNEDRVLVGLDLRRRPRRAGTPA